MTLDAASLLATPASLAGPEVPQPVRYSYWPCNYLNGDPHIISSVPFPLSGVRFSEQARGVGELRCTLQLADSTIRAMNPWDMFVPRKTGIVVVRSVMESNGEEKHSAVWHGILWQWPTDPATGRAEMQFKTIEGYWARRLITGPPPLGQRDAAGNLRPGMTWTQADQAQIVRDLLDPGKFSQLGNLPGQFPGWINVEAPVVNMGVPRDLTYRRGSETNLLQAHQDRSKVINGYEWKTGIRLLAGSDPYNAESFRLQFIWGYPRLGRRYDQGDDIPRFSYHLDGRGNVTDIKYAWNSEPVSNMVWGTGSGYDDDALRVYSSNSSDWTYGFLVTEERYSNPDVSVATTLQQQTDARLIQGYANERFIQKVTVRADHFPYFGTYAIGDDCLFTSDDWTWPNGGETGTGTTFVSRILGWTVTPLEGARSETVDLMLGGQEDVDG
jgi:hypothetical protein